MFHIIIAIWLKGAVVGGYMLPKVYANQVDCMTHGFDLQQHWVGKTKDTKWGFMCVRLIEA